MPFVNSEAERVNKRYSYEMCDHKIRFSRFCFQARSQKRRKKSLNKINRKDETIKEIIRIIPG